MFCGDLGRMEKEYKTTEAQRKATLKYNKLNAKNITLSLNNKTDKDILQHLEKQKNKTGYIKQLIRQDIKNNN